MLMLMLMLLLGAAELDPGRQPDSGASAGEGRSALRVGSADALVRPPGAGEDCRA